jgi:hypothetical protein
VANKKFCGCTYNFPKQKKCTSAFLPKKSLRATKGLTALAPIDLELIVIIEKDNKKQLRYSNILREKYTHEHGGARWSSGQCTQHLNVKAKQRL